MKAAPDRTLSRVALESGFTSSSEFSKAFRSRYGMAPSNWDRTSALVENRKYDQAGAPCRRYTDEELADDEAAGRFPVTIRELPATRVVHVRVTNSYDLDTIMGGYTRFITWLRAHNDGDMPAGRLIGMSQDDPDVTPAKLCRYDFCWEGDIAADGEFGERVLPACRVASVHIDGDIETLCRAWDYVYRHWLPRSNWQPANLPALEVYRRTPEEVGWTSFDLDGCVPVEPL
jgi:DNA gyrase inhibitor GyrI